MAQVNEADGVRVVMSPVQLVAVLNKQSIDPGATISNRLWGGLQLVGGVLEMFGAGVPCALPEPTGISKAGCVVFGVHGSDTAATGLRQIWTGRDTATLTQQGVTKLAEAMRASPDIASNIGLSLDIGVGFGVAGMVKAARVSSITMGRIHLMRHEVKSGTVRPGGHTLLKHVGRTDAQLQERLRLEPGRRMVSTFYDIEAAEWAITEVLRVNAIRIRRWARNPSPAKSAFDADVGKKVGRILFRDSGKFVEGSKVTVVLKYETYNGMPYYVLTAVVDV